MKRKSMIFFSAVLLASGLIGLVPSAQALVINPGFETPEVTFPGYVSTFGDWKGDQSLIVTIENGITPLEGSQMLRFDATGKNTASPLLTSCEIFQLIDVSAYISEISAGIATANMSAWFNRVSGDSQTDTYFALKILAFSGSPGSFPTQIQNGTRLDIIAKSIITDSDITSWEQVTASLLLPVATDFIAIKIQANENIFNNGVYPEFDGHYADLVSLNIQSAPIPEPSTIILLGSGLIGLAGWSRRNFNNRN